MKKKTNGKVGRPKKQKQVTVKPVFPVKVEITKEEFKQIILAGEDYILGSLVSKIINVL